MTAIASTYSKRNAEVTLKQPTKIYSLLLDILSRTRSTTIGRIFEDSSVVMITQFFAMAMVFLYSVITASWFGAGSEMDAFVMAGTIPNYIINLLTSGVSFAMIPAFVSAMKDEGHDAAQDLFANVGMLLLVSLVVIGVILIVSGPYVMPIICIGFDAATLTLATHLYYILVIAMVFTGFTELWGSALNTLRSFAMPGIARGTQNLCAAVLLLVLGTFLGAYVLPVGVLLGTVLHLAILGVFLAKKNIRLMPRLSRIGTRTKRALHQYASMFISAAFLGSTLVVDQVMASTLAPGSVASLNYGNTLALAFQNLLAMAFSTAMMPHFSTLSSEGNIRELRHAMGFYTLGSLIVTVPITLATFYWSDLIVRIVYERGGFTGEDTQIVTSVYKMAVLQIPFYLAIRPGWAILSSTFQNQVLMKTNLISTAFKIGLNFILMPWLGLPGLALATSGMYMLSCGLILFTTYSWLWRKGM